MTVCWTIHGKTIESAKNLIDTCLKHASLPSFAKVSWQNGELRILVEQGGKSEFAFLLKEVSGGVQVHETRRTVAFLHKPFAAAVEKMVEKFLHEAGFAKQN